MFTFIVNSITLFLKSKSENILICERIDIEENVH